MDGFDHETGEIAVAPFHFPLDVATAMVEVARQIKQIGQDEKNPHGGYQYVSVDKFYDVVGPLMAKAGLFLLVDEISADVREGASGKAWLFTRYALRFAHAKGVCSPPLYRSCAQPISGPQAFGAAQSYIEKQFLRQVFKIPTGEKDADELRPDDGAPARAPASRGRQTAGSANPVQAPPPATNGATAPSGASADDALRVWRATRDEIDACQTVPEIEAIFGSKEWIEDKAIITKGDPQHAAGAIQQLVDRAEARKGLLMGDDRMHVGEMG